MKKKKISIKDISRELGISTTTISFVINKKAENKISKEVIERVERYIRKVGYKPNSSAQTLRTGISRTIVLMVEDISDPFFSAIAREMEELAYRNGYKIISCSTENKRERTLELLNLFKERQVDAFIITPPEDFAEEMKLLVQSEDQTVMVFDRRYEDLDHNYVVLKNWEGAKKAVEALSNVGKKNIAFVGINSSLSSLQDRLNGYESAVQEQGLKKISLLLKFDETKTETGKHKIKDFLEAHDKIDGLLFATNTLAISGLKVMKEKEIRIPKDINVVSFDDRDVFELYAPTISVLAQPISELAHELIKGTLSLLDRERKIDLVQKELDGTLVIRESLSENPPSEKNYDKFNDIFAPEI